MITGIKNQAGMIQVTIIHIHKGYARIDNPGRIALGKHQRIARTHHGPIIHGNDRHRAGHRYTIGRSIIDPKA